jgi:hypothetical protein
MKTNTQLRLADISAAVGPAHNRAKIMSTFRHVTTTLAAMATVMGPGALLADEHESHYKDLYELKQLHIAFHQAVSHAGVDAATKAQHLADVLALWTDDGVLIAGGVTYSGKGTPGAVSCALGALTLCDFFANHAGSFVLGRDWVSLTPIFTEAIALHDRDKADIYWQCIYLDVNNNDLKVSNVTIGLPGQPDSGRASKVHGHWLFSHVESESIPPPTIDVDQ